MIYEAPRIKDLIEKARKPSSWGIGAAQEVMAYALIAISMMLWNIMLILIEEFQE